MRRVAIAAAIVALALAGTLALPVAEWRTGDQGLVPLEAVFEAPAETPARRVWIDTDAACGHGPRTDPDDCFAIALAAYSGTLEIAGISIVAGNAPLPVVERTTRELARRLSAETGRALPVHPGAGALREALRSGPLTILALGPLTNVAQALRDGAGASIGATRVVAVMGRRPGHLFHPAEGAGKGMLLGHGPVFRDFNFALDPRAAEAVLASGVSFTLVPYDAARGVEIGAADLARLAAAGGTRAWLAGRAVEWLAYWRDDIGRDGFFPFDLLAAGYLLRPEHLRCVRVAARVAVDDTLFIPFWRPRALLVGAPSSEGPSVRYCHRSKPGVKSALMNALRATGA